MLTYFITSNLRYLLFNTYLLKNLSNVQSITGVMNKTSIHSGTRWGWSTTLFRVVDHV